MGARASQKGFTSKNGFGATYSTTSYVRVVPPDLTYSDPGEPLTIGKPGHRQFTSASF